MVNEDLLPSCVNVEHTLQLHPIVFSQNAKTKSINIRVIQTEDPIYIQREVLGYWDNLRIEQAQALIAMLVKYIEEAQKERDTRDATRNKTASSC